MQEVSICTGKVLVLVLSYFMIQKQTQIKINLPVKLKKKIEKRAEEYDFTLAGYLKHLMVMDLRNEVPVYNPSKRALKSLRIALDGERNGKLREIDNLDEYFAKMMK